MRNRTFTKLDIDCGFQFISDSVEFNFIGRDINQNREKLNELVQIMSILHKVCYNSIVQLQPKVQYKLFYRKMLRSRN